MDYVGYAVTISKKNKKQLKYRPTRYIFINKLGLGTSRKLRWYDNRIVTL